MKIKRIFSFVFGLAFLFSLGLNIYLISKISSISNEVGSVCKDSDIEKVNQYLRAENIDGSMLKDFADEISSRKGFKKDANCLMAVLNLSRSYDSEGSSDTVKSLKELVNKGQNPSLNFDFMQSIKNVDVQGKG